VKVWKCTLLILYSNIYYNVDAISDFISTSFIVPSAGIALTKNIKNNDNGYKTITETMVIRIIIIILMKIISVLVSILL